MCLFVDIVKGAGHINSISMSQVQSQIKKVREICVEVSLKQQHSIG
jgi:hypothetical protein